MCISVASSLHRSVPRLRPWAILAAFGWVGFAPLALAQDAPPPLPPPTSTAAPPIAPPTGTTRMPPGYVPPSPAQPYPTPGYRAPNAYPPGYGTAPPGYGIPPGYGTAAPTYRYPYAPYAPSFPQSGLGPPTMAYVEGKPAPDGYHLESSPQKGLLIGGSVTLGSSYLLTLLVASALASDDTNTHPDRSGSETLPLFIPVFGPFIGIATLNPSPVGSGWLVLDGLTQATGAIMFITAFASPKQRYVRDDIALRWSVTPVALGRGGHGLGIAGSF